MGNWLKCCSIMTLAPRRTRKTFKRSLLSSEISLFARKNRQFNTFLFAPTRTLCLPNKASHRKAIKSPKSKSSLKLSKWENCHLASMITHKTKKTTWTMETMNFYARINQKTNTCEGSRLSVPKTLQSKPSKIAKKSIVSGPKMIFIGLKETLLNKMYRFLLIFRLINPIPSQKTIFLKALKNNRLDGGLATQNSNQHIQLRTI